MKRLPKLFTFACAYALCIFAGCILAEGLWSAARCVVYFFIWAFHR